MSDVDLNAAIKPKSDQLNADDLLTGSITVTIVDVRRGSKEQPVIIDINGLMPYKPCKSMIRVMVTAWGDQAKEWVGRSMTLYCDPNVKFGGVALGGIRISHLSDIGKTINMMLTSSRARKTEFIVQPLIAENHNEIIKRYIETPDGDEKQDLWGTLNTNQQAAILADFEKQKRS